MIEEDGNRNRGAETVVVMVNCDGKVDEMEKET